MKLPSSFWETVSVFQAELFVPHVGARQPDPPLHIKTLTLPHTYMYYMEYIYVRIFVQVAVGACSATGRYLAFSVGK